jgi:hypothetical protein
MAQLIIDGETIQPGRRVVANVVSTATSAYEGVFESISEDGWEIKIKLDDGLSVVVMRRNTEIKPKA